MKDFVVYRMDLLSRVKYPRERLLRLVITENKKVVIDPSYSMKGRGVYVLKDEEQIKKTFQKKRLSKIVMQSDEAALMEEMIEYVRRGNQQ